MTLRIAAVLLLTASLAAAESPTPSTAPSAAGGAATRPDESANRFPTPAEMIASMKAAKRALVATDDKPRVAYFDLSRPVVEKPADFSLFGGDEVNTLRSVLDRLDKARQDKDVSAVLLTLGETGINMSQALELRDALAALKAAGKRTFVYADAYDTHSYLVACGATDVCMLQGGEIMMPGVGLETMFAKGLLDKVGVEADYEQIGEYKGADEEYIHTQPSPELRGELDRLVDALYEQVVSTISTSRNLPREDVRKIVDDALITASAAKQRGLVDHLVDPDGLRDLLGTELGGKVDLVANYGQAARESIDLSSPFAFFSLLAKKPETSDRQAVALLYAEGVIVDGSSGGGLFSTSQNVGSEDMRAALRLAERDDKIKAVVIRIDSPGGSALASEAMWQAVAARAEDQARHRQRRQHGRQRRVLPRQRGRVHLRRPHRHRRFHRRGGREVRPQRPVRQDRPQHRLVPARGQRGAVRLQHALDDRRSGRWSTTGCRRRTCSSPSA